VLARQRTGDLARARREARDFLARFPRGPFSAQMAEIASGASPPP
jgi:hypothetical protein